MSLNVFNSNFVRKLFVDFTNELVSHTDSNREPTDYKSASPNLSSLIILDSKGYWSHRSRTLFYEPQTNHKSKTINLVFGRLGEMKKDKKNWFKIQFKKHNLEKEL